MNISAKFRRVSALALAIVSPLVMISREKNVSGTDFNTININGRNISVSEGEVYIDGVRYVPESGVRTKSKRFTPGRMTDHKFKGSSNFTAIMATGFVDIVYTPSATVSEVRGHMPENLIECLDVHVSDGTLFIGMKKDCGYNNFDLEGKSATIYVSGRNLKSVAKTGSCGFTVKGDLNAPDGFTISATGSGGLKCGLIKAGRATVNVTATGSGGVELSGAVCENLKAQITGSADVNFGTVTSRDAFLSVAGSGGAEISGSTDYVEFSVAGSGDVRAGDFRATKGKASVAGSGNIICNVEWLSDSVRGSGDVRNRH